MIRVLALLALAAFMLLSLALAILLRFTATRSGIEIAAGKVGMVNYAKVLANRTCWRR